jgi:hypothetical protein
MGRPATYPTDKVEDFRSIDIAWLRRKGACKVGYSGSMKWSRRGEVTASIGYRIEHNGIRLMYAHTQGWGAGAGVEQHVNEVIPFAYSQSPFGRRQWFACSSCQRRCRIIYGGSHFRCRHCRGAKYESQYEAEPIRISNRRWRIRKLIEERSGQEWPFGLDDGFPDKPKWMHRRTYKRLRTIDMRLSQQWTTSVGAWLSKRDRAPLARR